MLTRLLVIDDDEAGCRLLKAIFTAESLAVVAVHDGRAGLDHIAEHGADLVILDLQLPTIDGIEVLRRLKATQPLLPVVMLTSHNDVKTAVRAMELGAFYYLTKPIDPEEVVVVVRRALEARALRLEVEALRRQVGDRLADQMGPSGAVKEIMAQVEAVAASLFTVLILGETGVGKELVAQAIHAQSDRRLRPFVAIDCGAIPELLLESELFGHEKGAFTGADRLTKGRFHLAEGGTIFLDEIGNLPLNLQPKLLRVLESREVRSVGGAKSRVMDVRFVAATNDDLEARVADGRFRADLYFRLAQYTISLPPLRDRPTDIEYLAQRFLDEASIELRRPMHAIPREVHELLRTRGWPGNVRELRNVIRQAVLESKDMALQVTLVQRLMKLSAAPTEAPPRCDGRSLKEIGNQAAHDAERHAISDALRVAGGNQAQAAKALRTDYKTLYLKMKSLGIVARAFMR